MTGDLEYIEPEGDPIQRLNDQARIEKALKLAARDARLLHKRMGQPMVVWENGKVVWIPPEEIVVDPDEQEAAAGD